MFLRILLANVNGTGVLANHLCKILLRITIGIDLLQKMGWKEGQGIGPRVKRKPRRQKRGMFPLMYLFFGKEYSNVVYILVCLRTFWTNVLLCTLLLGIMTTCTGVGSLISV